MCDLKPSQQSDVGKDNGPNIYESEVLSDEAGEDCSENKIKGNALATYIPEKNFRTFSEVSVLSK